MEACHGKLVFSVGPLRNLTRREHLDNVFRSTAFSLQNTNVSEKILHFVFPCGTKNK